MEWIARRVQQWLWEDSGYAGRPPPWLKLSRLGYALLRDFLDGELSLRAMSLVYTTILAVVPLLAFSFSVLKGLGFHRTMEPALLRFLEPIGPQADEVAARIIGFVDNVSGATLATVSIVLLLLSALSMAQKVEASLNFVWRVDRPRSFGRRFTEYVSVMLMWPLLMSVATGLAAAAIARAARSPLASVGPIGDLIAALADLVPYAAIIAAFVFLYVLVPNTKVRFRPALVAGTLAGIIWAAGGTVFTRLVATASRTEVIYSGFAIVIVTMLWLYLSWLILLLGAQLAFYLQHPAYLRLGRRTEALAGALRERLALATMVLVGLDFERPGEGWRADSIASALGVPQHYVDRTIKALEDAGLLTETAGQRLIPAKDPRRISLASITDAVRHAPAAALAGEGAWTASVRATAARIDQAIRDALGERTLADLIEAEIASTQAAAREE